MLAFLLLAQFRLYKALTALSPRQLFWYILLAYTVAIGIATIPGVLPDNIDILISRIQNAVSVAFVGYIARTPFPVDRQSGVHTRETDNPQTPSIPSGS